MTDGIKKMYFKLKDQSVPAGRKKQKTVKAETVFFTASSDETWSPDIEEQVNKPICNDEDAYMNEADRKFHEMRRRGVFACPRFDKFWEDPDLKMT